MQNIQEQTLAGIALSNHEYIPVLEKYSLDFCCRGKKTLADACSEKELSVNTIADELIASVKTATTRMPFTEMSADELISFILIHHHFYVKNSVATIHSHIEKVATKHGDRYTHMPRVLELFTAVAEELLQHMVKEEQILFPRIKKVAAADTPESFVAMGPGFISAPIQMMESEHDNAGQLLFEIRDLTNNYTPPEDACTTHRVCLEELKAFEEDLHQHVHLENNILFPLAMKLILVNSN